MNIQKEYELTINDYINFQKFYQKIQPIKQSYVQHIILSLPAFFILFSIRYVEDSIVVLMGIIISLLFFLNYIFLSVFSEKIFEKYLTKIYYKNFISDNIKIIITEHSIIESNAFFERKTLPKWVYNCKENNDYIYLFNNKNYAIILPKKYFSDEEQEMIKKYYGNNP
jgi:hypothetical protein